LAEVRPIDLRLLAGRRRQVQQSLSLAEMTRARDRGLGCDVMLLLIWRPDGSRLTPRLVVAERKGRCGSGGVRQARVAAHERLFNEKYHLFKKPAKTHNLLCAALGEYDGSRLSSLPVARR
jgi:hypothetical protein